MKQFVYLLEHVYKQKCGIPEIKRLGAFFEISKINEIIELYKTLPGFKEKPTDFCLYKYEMDKLYQSGRCEEMYQQEMPTSILLDEENGCMRQYVYIIDYWVESECGADLVKTLGIFSEYIKAQRAIEMCKNFREFKDHPNNFNIDKYEIGALHWVEGYVTVTECQC